MASYLRPRRGKRATAESQAIVLKRGEVFFECPDTGVGTGIGKIKVGDGSTTYANLPYYLESFNINSDTATIAFIDSNTPTEQSNNPTYLTNIKPTNSVKNIFTNLKQLLVNYNAYFATVDKTFEKHSIRINNAIGSYTETTLAANKWNTESKEYSLEDEYPSTTYDIEISLAPSATSDQMNAAAGANMVGSASRNVITALGTVPETAISVIVHIVNKNNDPS